MKSPQEHVFLEDKVQVSNILREYSNKTDSLLQRKAALRWGCKIETQSRYFNTVY